LKLVAWGLTLATLGSSRLELDACGLKLGA